MGLPRHPRVPSPQTPGAGSLPEVRRATQQEHDEGPPSGGFLQRSHKPSSSRLRAQCLPGLREQQRPQGTGWEGQPAWDEGSVPRNARHPDALAHAGWGLYRARVARLGGPGSRPNLCRAAPQHSLCERGNGWWRRLRARVTPTARATPGPWRMETLGLSPTLALTQSRGREEVPTRPRGGRPCRA